MSNDWLAEMVELGAWLERNGAPPQQADAERFIQERFQARGLKQPAESHGRKRAALVRGAKARAGVS